MRSSSTRACAEFALRLIITRVIQTRAAINVNCKGDGGQAYALFYAMSICRGSMAAANPRPPSAQSLWSPAIHISPECNPLLSNLAFFSPPILSRRPLASVPKSLPNTQRVLHQLPGIHVSRLWRPEWSLFDALLRRPLQKLTPSPHCLPPFLRSYTRSPYSANSCSKFYPLTSPAATAKPTIA